MNKKQQKIIYYFVGILFLLLLVYYILVSIDKKKEGFIGRHYRPIVRNFRKSVSPYLNNLFNKWYISYKKFMY